MKINGINGFTSQLGKIAEVNKSSDPKFGNILGDFVKQVNNDQNESGKITRDFLEGKDVEIHEVMIAGQKAQTSLELLMS